MVRRCCAALSSQLLTGKEWVVQESRVPNSNGMPEPIWDVHFADENIGIAAAEFGVILRTKDGGTTWTSLESRPVAARLQGIHMLSTNEAWIVGDKANHPPYHRWGRNLGHRLKHKRTSRRPISITTRSVGQSGSQRSILHTDDGGETWRPQNSGNVFELFGVGFVNESKGYIVGSKRRIG